MCVAIAFGRCAENVSTFVDDMFAGTLVSSVICHRCRTVCHLVSYSMSSYVIWYVTLFYAMSSCVIQYVILCHMVCHLVLRYVILYEILCHTICHLVICCHTVCNLVSAILSYGMSSCYCNVRYIAMTLSCRTVAIASYFCKMKFRILFIH